MNVFECIRHKFAYSSTILERQGEKIKKRMQQSFQRDYDSLNIFTRKLLAKKFLYQSYFNRKH